MNSNVDTLLCCFFFVGFFLFCGYLCGYNVNFDVDIIEYYNNIYNLLLYYYRDCFPWYKLEINFNIHVKSAMAER